MRERERMFAAYGIVRIKRQLSTYLGSEAPIQYMIQVGNSSSMIPNAMSLRELGLAK